MTGDWIEWQACVHCSHSDDSHDRSSRACLRTTWHRWWFRRCLCKQYTSWTEFPA